MLIYRQSKDSSLASEIDFCCHVTALLRDQNWGLSIRKGYMDESMGIDINTYIFMSQVNIYQIIDIAEKFS